MTGFIMLFFVLGALFGLATGSSQHLFSEGAVRRGKDAVPYSRGSRVLWVLICSCLWPIFLLTGAPTLWRLARARAGRARGR